MMIVITDQSGNFLGGVDNLNRKISGGKNWVENFYVLKETTDFIAWISTSDNVRITYYANFRDIRFPKNATSSGPMENNFELFIDLGNVMDILIWYGFGPDLILGPLHCHMRRAQNRISINIM